MQLKSRFLFAAALAAALAGQAALAGPVAQDAAAPTKFTGKVGDMRKYKVVISFDINGAPGKATADATEKVTDVAADGRVSVESGQMNVVISFGGQDQNAPDEPATTMVYLPNGALDDISGESVTADTRSSEIRMAALGAVKLPDAPLAKGLAWTWDVAKDAKKGFVKAQGKYKVLGDEKADGVDSWKLDFSVVELEGDAPASSKGTVWISKANGTVVKRVGKDVNLPIPGAPAPISGDETVDLVSS